MMITKAQVELVKDYIDEGIGPTYCKAMQALIAVGEKLADGHALVPVEPTPEMIAAAWKLVRERWPMGQFLGPGPAFKECMMAMIAAAK